MKLEDLFSSGRLKEIKLRLFIFLNAWIRLWGAGFKKEHKPKLMATFHQKLEKVTLCYLNQSDI